MLGEPLVTPEIASDARLYNILQSERGWPEVSHNDFMTTTSEVWYTIKIGQNYSRITARNEVKAASGL